MAGDSGEAPAKRSPSVFLSYSRADLNRARPVIVLLEAAGFDLWWDDRLEGGENYLATTEDRLESADCVAVLWPQTSNASHWVRDKAQRERERGCLVPLSLDGTMAPLGFRQFQLLDISGWSGDPGDALAGRVLAAVRARTGQGNAVHEPPVPFTVPPPAVSTAAPAPGLALSRRTLIIGGDTLAGGAGLVGLWQSGLLGSSEAKAISMVVLPFRNLTGDVSKAWFSNGLSNELRAVLVRNPRLKVAAPTSSGAIEGEDEFAIGRKLGVDHILRGSVQRDETQMRVSAELVAVANDEVQWGESYDRALKDVFAVQSEIARTVAVALVAEFAGASEAERAADRQQGRGADRPCFISGGTSRILRPGVAMASRSLGTIARRPIPCGMSCRRESVRPSGRMPNLSPKGPVRINRSMKRAGPLWVRPTRISIACVPRANDRPSMTSRLTTCTIRPELEQLRNASN